MNNSRDDVRFIIKTYEPNGEFNHYCTWCMGKNECTCTSAKRHDIGIDSECSLTKRRICECGKLSCDCKVQQTSLDLILSSIATATNSVIQDNINIDQWRYVIVKSKIGIPTKVIDDRIIINNIEFELPDPEMFEKLNILLNSSVYELIQKFMNASIYGPSTILHSIMPPSGYSQVASRFMLIYPDHDKNDFRGDIIIRGKCIGYNTGPEGTYTRETDYP